jgi:hypothetical protein
MPQHPQAPIHMQAYGFDPSTGMPYLVDPGVPLPHPMYAPMGQPGTRDPREVLEPQRLRREISRVERASLSFFF